MIPLADRMRPDTIEEMVGQTHIIASGKLLYKAIKNKQLFSMILWGPPGVGKTTLARIIANETGADFLEFSAVNTSTVELKKIFAGLKEKKDSGRDKMTIIFIDEIHRFSKFQQDAFLSYVENGTITLIGATTQNPSFEIIGPLLSRSRVLVLKPLTEEDLSEIIKRGLKELGVKIDSKAKKLLVELSDGDGRVLLNTLEIAASFLPIPVILIPSLSREKDITPELYSSLVTQNDRSEVDQVRFNRTQNDKSGIQHERIITKEMIEEAFQKKALMYDKAGEEHYNTISAFIKSMRASNADAALYYLARMVEAGEDPLFIARRMVIFASEDIGQAQPTALVVANEVFRSCETIGYPECQINLAHGVVYLSSAKKDRSAYEAYFKALEDVRKLGNLSIPMNLRNAPTKLMQSLGYGEGYSKYTKEDLLPDKLKGKKYYTEKK